MRLPRFHRLRGRLSYANVMATLAFFFALTGGAMAGVKYISANDPIPSPSDLAGSTYGNPVIAAGKVTSAKIADGAITSSKFDSAATAPNATTLAGHSLTDFPLVVAHGSVTPPPDTLVPDTCLSEAVDGPGLNADTDVVVVSAPKNSGSTLLFHGYVLDDHGFGTHIGFDFCNPYSFDLPIAGTFRYAVLR